MIQKFNQFLLVLLMLIPLCCGFKTRAVQVFPGPSLPDHGVAFIFLKVPKLNWEFDKTPPAFTISIGEKSFQIGSGAILKINPGFIEMVLRGDPLEQIKIESDKERLYDFSQSPSRWKNSTKQTMTYSGKRIFYPEQDGKLAFMAEPGKRYRLKFSVEKKSQTEDILSVKCFVLEKKSKKSVSNTVKIVYR